MNPATDKQLKLVMKLYPDVQYDDVKDMSSLEASQLISQKLGDSPPREGSGWKAPPRQESKPYVPANASNGDRDRLIVRQSCLKAAIEYCSKSPTLVERANILSIAQEFEQWVFRP